MDCPWLTDNAINFQNAKKILNIKYATFSLVRYITNYISCIYIFDSVIQ